MKTGGLRISKLYLLDIEHLKRHEKYGKCLGRRAKIGLQVNARKTKTMRIWLIITKKLYIEQQEMQQVDDF